MTKAFYPRIAASNLMKNGKFYLPYILTVIFSSAVFYIVLAMAGIPLGDQLRYNYLANYMSMGSVILGIFIIVFLNYTNSFLMKRRNKELGLYNVLGMGKGNIAKVLFFESLYTWLVGTGGGLILGTLLLKLVLMFAGKLINFDVPKAYFSPFAAGVTAALFGVIMLLILLKNLWKLKKLKTIELLRGNNVSEKEPKTRWLSAIIGVLSLGGGYYLALTSKSAISALQYYFVAVILVIIGTYCLFSAVSITVLKLLRKNKKFYYKTGHFIGVSGMLHRMNRNAVGLANICILSTMVLVMVSGTLSLYLGIEDIMEQNNPSEIVMRLNSSDSELTEKLESEKFFETSLENNGLKIENFESYESLPLVLCKLGDEFEPMREFSPEIQMGNLGEFYDFLFISLDTYNKITGENAVLSHGQAILAGSKAKSDRINLTFGDACKLSYELIQGVEDFWMPVAVNSISGGIVTVVLPDSAELWKIKDASQKFTESDNGLEFYVGTTYLIDVVGGAEEEYSAYNAISGDFRKFLSDNQEGANYYLSSREEDKALQYESNGGFLFLGLILGTIFLMAMVLIMYYRQISDGYEDRERFLVMQQVGLPKKEIRKSINLQILTVFFAPLIVAGIHLVMDFNLMRLLLTMFRLQNFKLTAVCSLVCFLVFALIYGIIYALTAKTYYKIVSEKNTD